MFIRALCGTASAALRRAWPVVFVALLTACGGGGGGGGGSAATATSVAPAAAASLAIAGFTPSTGGAGATIMISGAGFTGLQAASLASVPATFTVVSDGQLQLVVPPGAQTGRIELTVSGRTVLSAADFTVDTTPQLTSLAPASVLPGARVTLNGTSLDRVAQVRVNATVLPIVSQAPSSMVVEVPGAATSGIVTLVDLGGTARPQSQQLTVVAPMTLTSFTPTSVVTGQALTLNGTNLDRVIAVVFAGGASAPVATRAGTTRITVTVPDSAASGALQMQGNAGDTVTSGAPLAVVPAIRVDAAAVYRVGAAGANVTMTGTGLTEVAAVTVRSLAASIVSKTPTQLVFTVPAGFACGAIALQSGSQPTVAGGSVVVGAGCTASLAGIEFAQVLSQAATEPRQRLVPGKETWVRAYVVSDQTGIVSPSVRLTGYRGAAILGTLDMTGPATLPQSAGGAVAAAIRYSEVQSFNLLLPPSWVASGLSVRIEVDPEQRLGSTTVQDATPSVGTPTRLEIVLVPVVSGSFIPTVPTNAAVLDELTRRFPIPRDRIVVTTRASYALASVTNGVGDADGNTSSAEWSTALSELRQLRDSENPNNPNRYYFGFVRRSAGGVAGIGYVPGRTALGWDSSTGWMRTMSHELGHNFGRPHAPCGGVASPDPNWPAEYAGGILGPQPLVDSVPVAFDVLSPVSQTDIMGYCSGAWFSDYNYRLIQTHLESQPQAALAVAQAADAASEMLLIAGTIGLDGMRLHPVKALRGTPERGAGDYTLRLLTRDGRTIEHAFDADLVDHAMVPERHFAVTVLNPGPLERIEVRRGDSVVPPVAAPATAQRARGAVGEPLAVDWNEGAGRLTMRWNAAAAHFASVTHVFEGQRTVLAMHRRGGELVADTADLPAGGTFEFSLSDGLNAHLMSVRR